MAKNNAVQIKHTKKGMKKLLKNLYLLQMNYVSVGIHKSDNKTTSGEKQKKEFNKLQKHLKNMGQESNGSNSSPNSGSGLDGGEKKSSPKSARQRTFNLATLAYYLEQPISWIQRKSVNLLAKDGDIVTIHAGARISRPARIFIRIFKLTNIWNKVRAFIQRQVRNLYVQAGTNRRVFWQAIGTMAHQEQKNIIRTSASAANSDITVKLKGQNHPLFDTGGLENSINYKINKNYNNNASKIARNKFLMDFDKQWEQFK